MGELRVAVSHVLRVEMRGGREEALVGLSAYVRKEKIREEGEEMWVDVRRLPEQLRNIARCMLDARRKRERSIGGGGAEAGRQGRSRSRQVFFERPGLGGRGA